MSQENKFECRDDLMCRPYCQVLQEQGLNIGDSSVCATPDLIANKDASLQTSELTRVVSEKLSTMLLDGNHETGPDPSEALLQAHNSVFDARKTLWTSMIKSAKAGRQFTDAEKEYYSDQIEAQITARTAVNAETEPGNAIKAQARFDSSTLENYGLLFDDQIVNVVDQVVGNVMDGRATLLVGEKGIAKTQIAKFVARLVDGEDSERTPIIISGHGSMMSDELIGKTELVEGNTVFHEGKLVQAMKEGRVPILDEANLSDQMIMMRLQDILLRKPGDKILLQENGTAPIEIQPGFAPIATANEYQNRETFDTAFRDRFEVISMHYPDENVEQIKEFPADLLRLGLAAALMPNGELSKHTPGDDIETLVRLAHATQRLYTTPSKKIASSQLKENISVIIDDEEPLMTDCITPRTVFEVIHRASRGNKASQSLEQQQTRLIKGLDQANSTHNQDYAKKILKLLQRGTEDNVGGSDDTVNN